MVEDWEGVVFDLDGTVVHLPVDWDTVAAELASELADLDGTAMAHDTWDYLDLAREADSLDRAERVIAQHEIVGARQSERLPLADYVEDVDVHVGVCSLNCEQACRVALETHDLERSVDAIVGRDTVSNWKPDPEPLRAVIDELGVSPESSVFIGDSPRDAATAAPLAVSFRDVEDMLATIE